MDNSWKFPQSMSLISVPLVEALAHCLLIERRWRLKTLLMLRELKEKSSFSGLWITRTS